MSWTGIPLIHRIARRGIPTAFRSVNRATFAGSQNNTTWARCPGRGGMSVGYGKWW
jgi:hypothetical protein